MGAGSRAISPHAAVEESVAKGSLSALLMRMVLRLAVARLGGQSGDAQTPAKESSDTGFPPFALHNGSATLRWDAGVAQLAERLPTRR
jgi:hypothetical protein